MEPIREPCLALLGSKDFVPDKYVRELSQNCVGGPELRRLRKKIQSLSEKVNSNLKRNVYQNYMQFIDTAKEISHLESEMYQLSHLLSEHKSLLNTLATTSISGDDTPIKTETENKENNQENENRQKLAAILEKVEGPKELLDIPGRTYLFEGDLLEVDPLDGITIKTIHAYLFTDGFMTCKRNLTSGSLMKYTFETLYELGSLAIVNVRDIGNNKHAFKLLMFPDTRVFQCTSSSNKKEWLDKFDQAKKARLTQEQLKRESTTDKSPSRAVSIDVQNYNPFEDADDESGTSSSTHPEWFLEIPEELDVCVAQRHFEEALAFLQKSKDYIAAATASTANNDPLPVVDPVLVDIQRKVDQRQCHLIDVLTKELEVDPDKSLQGGLRAARRAVRLLNQLDRSTQACDLFLKLCSSMLKTQCKRVKREGSTNMYVRHLSSVVFTNLCHMTEEFLRAFSSSSDCSSAYVVWVSGELSLFTTHFIKQVFMPQTSLTTLTECIQLLRSQCERLYTYGVDLCYQLNGALRAPLMQALKDARDKAIDAAKLRALEDKWIPLNLRTRSGLSRFLQEYNEMGLKLEPYVTGDVWIQLTSNTLSFTKLYLIFIDDCLKLQTTELIYSIEEILCDIFEAQIRHIEVSMRNEPEMKQREFMAKNAEFLLISLYNLSQNRYSEAMGFECNSIKKMQRNHIGLLKGDFTATSPTKKQKYSSDFL